MRIALIVNKVTGCLKTNLSHMEELGRKAAQSRVDLILYPEAAPTGLINNDDPAHDLSLGTPIPGPITERLGRLAGQTKAHLASGILERDGNCLYDSAIILDPTGKIVLHYRRIQPQWHGRKADPHVYRQGEEVVAASTPFGKLSVLICGDLFDDRIVAKLRELGPDYLLFPFSVDFDDGSFDQRRWDQEEQPAYVARAAAAGCTIMMTNLLVDPAVADCPSYGGAMVVSPRGEVLARKPLGQPGVLVADV